MSRLPVRAAAAVAVALFCVALAPSPAAAHDTAAAPDCEGETSAALGVAADWAAVELVGWVLGTSCLIDAGERSSDRLPAASRAAVEGRSVVVVGGRAAVPDAKLSLAGVRVRVRLGGADRLETMRAVVVWADAQPAERAAAAAAEALSGLAVEPEHDGSGYDRRHYEHDSAVLCDVIAAATDPYTGLPFGPDTCAVDHVVAAREAHESGGHAWTAERRREFGRDRANLVASRDCVHLSKGGHDVGSWHGVASGSCAGAALDALGACFWARVTVAVKAKWGLTVDAAEADALSQALVGC